MTKNEKMFYDYAYQFDQSVKIINYKYKHSLRVMNNSKIIAKSLCLEKNDIELAKFIGLTHDISRFYQWTKYETFDDSKSLDHGEKSTDILFKEGLIHSFKLSKEDYKIVFSAIKNHNKFEIDNNISDNRELLHAKIIRDADKLDILYAFSSNRILELQSDDSQISSIIKDNFYNHKTVEFKDVKNKNERVLELIALIYDINFIESLKIIKKNNYINKIYKHTKNKNIFKPYIEFMNMYVSERIKENVR